MNINKFFLFALLGSLVMLLTFFFIEKMNVMKSRTENKLLNKALNESFEKFVFYMDERSDIAIGHLKEKVFPVKNVLVYRFKEDMCDECVDQDLGELYNFQQQVGKHNLLILPNYEENSKNNMYLSNRLNHFSYKNLSDSIIGFPLKQTTGHFVRYLAYIGEDSKISSIFFPIKFERQLTQIYLHVLATRIQKGKLIENDENDKIS